MKKLIITIRADDRAHPIDDAQTQIAAIIRTAATDAFAQLGLSCEVESITVERPTRIEEMPLESMPTIADLLDDDDEDQDD